MDLGISVAPARICAYASSSCPAATGAARVTLTANALAGAVGSWPSVQVAFVLETTLYDGVYDGTAGDPGTDPCAAQSDVACEESNGVPFFVANAQTIAEDIQAAHARSQVSFALVDYFATLTDHDDDDGSEYHVDLQDFVPASAFGTAVHATFQDEVLLGGYTYPDSDFADNTLDSSSITALYGTITGSGLDWSNTTHHVIVWIGSTCPRDPSCVVNYDVDPSGPPSLSSSCEPSYAFPAGASPPCEGWVDSQNGNASDSIANLARTAPSCVGSAGGSCTIDTVDLWTTPTDPYSAGWGAYAGTSVVLADVGKILDAGCDLAEATGGTWDGPAGFTCPDGDTGDLQYVPHGPYDDPDTSNPTLQAALASVGFGPAPDPTAAAGADGPLFTFVPFGSITLPAASSLESTAACEVPGGVLASCDLQPQLQLEDGLRTLAWNWSTVPSENVLASGDSWTASFDVIDEGPPFGAEPVDACTTAGCLAGGSGPEGPLVTAAHYRSPIDGSAISTSFPLATLTVEPSSPGGAPPSGPGAPGPVGPGAPGGLPASISVNHALGLGSPSGGLGNPTLQAAAAGFLGAGFVRISLRTARHAAPVVVPVASPRRPIPGRGGPPGARGFD